MSLDLQACNGTALSLFCKGYASVLTPMWAPSALCRKLFQRYLKIHNGQVFEDEALTAHGQNSPCQKGGKKSSTDFEHISGNTKGTQRNAKHTEVILLAGKILYRARLGARAAISSRKLCRGNKWNKKALLLLSVLQKIH
jgi:hypothetical protein